MSFALYMLTMLLALAAPSALPPPAANQPVPESDDQCELSLSPTDLTQLLDGSFADQAGVWAEYAPLKGDTPDTTAVMRLSIIQDAETKKAGFELWFDKLGEFAVRTRSSASGEIIQELKQGSRAFLVPPAEEKKRSKETCRIENLIKKELQSSVKEKKTPTHLKTLAGEFDCQEVSVQSFKGELKVFVSEAAPLLKIVKLVLWNGNAIELVAHGKNAYSAFTPDLAIIPMSKLTEMMETMQAEMKNPQGAPAATAPASADSNAAMSIPASDATPAQAATPDAQRPPAGTSDKEEKEASPSPAVAQP